MNRNGNDECYYTLQQVPLSPSNFPFQYLDRMVGNQGEQVQKAPANQRPPVNWVVTIISNPPLFVIPSFHCHRLEPS